jgi:hypothetical protein
MVIPADVTVNRRYMFFVKENFLCITESIQTQLVAEGCNCPSVPSTA